MFKDSATQAQIDKYAQDVESNGMYCISSTDPRPNTISL